MKTISILNHLGNPIQANLICAFTCPETGKNYVAIDNGDIVFSENSSYNNLDILEIIKEEKNEYTVSNISEKDWEAVQKTLIEEIFSKIK